MQEIENRIRAVLQNNVGFENISDWMEYAIKHDFRPVKAVRVPHCPDCSGAPRSGTWGQYVYYSTLIHLIECGSCGLVWADANIDPSTVLDHFEVAYKDNRYFRVSREAIFEHLSNVISRLSPKGASILDIGGARGDLMAKVVARRPDLRVVINDISKEATDWAAEHFGFATLTGSANDLAVHRDRYDVVVLSDVLYYEPNIKVLWNALSRLIRKGGSIVIRVPNKYFMIRLGQFWYRFTRTKSQQGMQDKISFFNPEHIFVLRYKYIHNRLMSMGFKEVEITPSPLLGGGNAYSLGPLFFQLAVKVIKMSGYCLTPAMLVIGSKLGQDAADIASG